MSDIFILVILFAAAFSIGLHARLIFDLLDSKWHQGEVVQVDQPMSPRMSFLAREYASLGSVARSRFDHASAAGHIELLGREGVSPVILPGWRHVTFCINANGSVEFVDYFPGTGCWFISGRDKEGVGIVRLLRIVRGEQ